MALALGLSANAAAGHESAIRIEPIRPGIHIVEHSYPWPANSAVLEMRSGEVVLVDTPYTPAATVDVLDWAKQKLGRIPAAAINTHYHIDRLGGNPALIHAGIPVHGSDHTAALLREKGRSLHRKLAEWVQDSSIREYYQNLELTPPNRIFPEAAGVRLRFGSDELEVIFPGPAHTPDNVVVWWPQRKFLFAGCPVIASAKLGNLMEADLGSWPRALDRLAALGPEVVIPGHGGSAMNYSAALILHTRKLLSQESR